MFRTAAVVACAIICGACQDAPTSPAPRQPITYVVDAAVKEALLPDAAAGIAGARVEVIEGPDAGKFCVTNDVGNCVLEVATQTATGTQTPFIRSSRDGFRPATSRFVVGYGVAKGTFIMARDSTPELAGDYDVTVTAASSCTRLSPDNRTFSTTAIISHPSNPAYVLFELPTPGRCNYLYGLIRPAGDVELTHDSDCDFPRPAGPLVIIGPPSPRQVTAGGSWTGRLVDGVLTLAQSGFLSVTAPGGDESCQAPDHRWDFRRK